MDHTQMAVGKGAVAKTFAMDSLELSSMTFGIGAGGGLMRPGRARPEAPISGVAQQGFATAAGWRCLS